MPSGKEAILPGFLDCSNAYLPVDEELPPANKLFGPKSSKTYAVTVTETGTQPGRRIQRRKVVNCEFEPSVQIPNSSIGCQSGTFWNNSAGHSTGSGGVLSNSEDKLHQSCSGSDVRMTNHEDSANLPGGDFSSRAPGHLYESSNTLLTNPSQLPLSSEHSGGSGMQPQAFNMPRNSRHPPIILPDGSLSARATLSRSPFSRTETPALSSHVSSPRKRDEFNKTSSSIQSAMSEPLNRFVQSAKKHVTALRPNVGLPFVLPFGRNQQNGPRANFDEEDSYYEGSEYYYDEDESARVTWRDSVQDQGMIRRDDSIAFEDDTFDSYASLPGFRDSSMSQSSPLNRRTWRQTVNQRDSQQSRSTQFTAMNSRNERQSQWGAKRSQTGWDAQGRNTVSVRHDRLSQWGGRGQASNRLTASNERGVLSRNVGRSPTNNRLSTIDDLTQSQAGGRSVGIRKQPTVRQGTESSLLAKAEKSWEMEKGVTKIPSRKKKERATWFENFSKQPTIKKSNNDREDWEIKQIYGDRESSEEHFSGLYSSEAQHETTDALVDLAKRLGLGEDRAMTQQNILRKLRLRGTKKTRMQKLKQGRKTKNRGGARRKAARDTELSLPAEEVRVLKEAFQRYDEDDSGDLDLREVNEAFQDLGLKPKTQDEKIELAKILEELAGEAHGGLIFPEFCQVVQTIRQKIQDSQTAVLFSVFQRFDEDGSGLLDKDEALQILGELQIAPQSEQEEVTVFKVMDDITEESDHPGQVGFSEFQAMIIKVREIIQQMRRAREREIRDLHNLDPDTFALFRPELITVYTAFCHYDADGSGKLDVDEIKGLLAQFGLNPRCKQEQDAMDKLLMGNSNSEADDDAEPEFDFPSYLHLISRLRAKVAADKRDELQEVFAQYDKDQSGDLSMREVSSILLDLGLQPRTRAEQEEIQLMMEEVDEDGSESCDFEEFCVLFQRISEKLQAMQREAERRKALELNFTLTDLQELRQSFETLDKNGNGVLEISEIRRALQLMRKRIPSDTLRDLFDEVDADGSGVLEFQEFLVLMRNIEESPELETVNPDSVGRQSNNLGDLTAQIRASRGKNHQSIVLDTGVSGSSTKALDQLKKTGAIRSGSKTGTGGNAKGEAQVFVRC